MQLQLYAASVVRCGLVCNCSACALCNVVGRGGSMVDLSPFVQRVVGHHVGILGKSFTRSCLWRFGVKPQHSICAVSGAPLSSSGLGEAL